MISYSFTPPRGAKRCAVWLSPQKTWGVVALFCPWMFHVGFEIWDHGISFNIGPLSLGIASLEEADHGNAG
jgi:hypothetical protein